MNAVFKAADDLMHRIDDFDENTRHDIEHVCKYALEMLASHHKYPDGICPLCDRVVIKNSDGSKSISCQCRGNY